MTLTEFVHELQPLKSIWSQGFPDVRLERIYAEVKSFEVHALKKIVMGFIDSSTRCPTVNDFRLAAARVREGLNFGNKLKHSRQAEDWWVMTLADDEIQGRLKIIRDRINGKVPDKDWEGLHDFSEEARK